MKNETNGYPTRHTHRLRNAILILIAVLAAAGIFLFVINRWSVSITLSGSEKVHQECMEPYEDKGASADATGSILRGIHLRVPVHESGTVDVKKPGSYTVTYTARFAWIRESRTRTVVVSDTHAPDISLNYIPDYYTLPGHTYREEGFSARDAVDGDVTAEVETSENNGIVTYTVTDRAGNTATVYRPIVYDDRTAPVLKLTGGKDAYIYVGDDWKTQVTANDNVDGDLTDKITADPAIDTSKSGTYQVTYSVSDSYGNTAYATQTLTVKPAPKNDTANIDWNKVIYLTFDDGPGQYTQQLLDILAKHNVKATFFVTNQYPAYQSMIAKEAQAGHTVAIHTYSHDYAKIYQSDTAYWNDFEQMEDVIQKQTGTRTNIFRFPGGSSNTISANYQKGIMTKLTQEANEKGYIYVDWNLTSGDAGETTDSNVIRDNIERIVQQQKVSVVLCHDIHPFTVNAMDETITWCLEHGYTFLPLTESSPVCHHHVNN